IAKGYTTRNNTLASRSDGRRLPGASSRRPVYARRVGLAAPGAARLIPRAKRSMGDLRRRRLPKPDGARVEFNPYHRAGSKARRGRHDGANVLGAEAQTVLELIAQESHPLHHGTPSGIAIGFHDLDPFLPDRKHHSVTRRERIRRFDSKVRVAGGGHDDLAAG